jgi:hypothetical protein
MHRRETLDRPVFQPADIIQQFPQLTGKRLFQCRRGAPVYVHDIRRVHDSVNMAYFMNISKPYLNRNITQGAIAKYCNRTEFRIQNSGFRSCKPKGYARDQGGLSSSFSMTPL